MKIGIHEAKTKLSKLIPVQEQGSARPLGVYADKIKFRVDLLEPLPKEIIDDFWGKEDDRAVSS